MPLATFPAPGMTAANDKPVRVTKRRAETRARLIDAAINVFAEKGYAQVVIEDVCRAAGYTRGAFYSQFESLEELLFVVYYQWTDRIAEQIRIGLEVEGASDNLPVVAARIVETLLGERDWLLIKADLLSVAARNPQLAKRWSRSRGELRTVIESRLAANGFESDASIGTSADTARAIIAIYDGLSTQLLLDTDDKAARAWLTRLLNVVLPPHCVAKG